MQLHQALNLKEQEVIAFVGAGGKTSALVCLARELAAVGKRVVVAPTTKMFLSQLEQLADPIIASDSRLLAEQVQKRLKYEHLLTCASGVNRQGKATGLDEAAVAALKELDIDYLLLEADGAAGAWFKAPAGHEPVIPPQTTLVVTLAGLKVIGSPLARPYVYRSEIVAELSGKEQGALLAAADLTRVLLHPAGGRKAVPATARWAVLLNQAEDYDLLAAGRAMATEILKDGCDRVILGAVATSYPVRQLLPAAATRPGPVGIIVLAAGSGERLGRVKQLLPLGGHPLVRRTLTNVLAADLGPTVVVTGYEAERVAAALAGLPVNIAVNPQYRRGLSASLKAGLAAQPPDMQAAFFVLADQPGVTAQVMQQLAAAYLKNNKKIVAPAYRGQRGNPVLIDRKLWPLLLQLEGDTGAREVIKSHPQELLTVEVDCPGVLKDIDTMADYRQWLLKE
ncbi:MAG: molybdenum cofactor cytidylyltransferase [Clostridia bacterium]|nr:molybdenum cofactor cytidylyltransferase [Clostridia bacterium]